MEEKKTVKFSDIKEKLEEELNKRINASPIPNENQGFTLIEGFMTPSVIGEISHDFRIGGPNIPMVGIVGMQSGRIYTFALKAIMPNIEV